MEGFIVGPTGTFCSLFHVANIQNHPSVQSTVEAYHLKFLRAPIGRWAAATGSFNNVMNELWEFRPDGMGSIQELGPFLHPREETLYFEWKEYDDFSILVKRLYWIEDEEEYQWVKVTYAFEEVTHDMGTEIAMVEVEEAGQHREGFGHSFQMLEGPLAYLGPSRNFEPKKHTDHH